MDITMSVSLISIFASALGCTLYIVTKTYYLTNIVKTINVKFYGKISS